MVPEIKHFVSQNMCALLSSEHHYSKEFATYLKALQDIQLQSQAFGRDSKSIEKLDQDPAPSSHHLKHVETNHFTIFVGFLGNEGLEFVFCFAIYWVHAPIKSQSECCYLSALYWRLDTRPNIAGFTEEFFI